MLARWLRSLGSPPVVVLEVKELLGPLFDHTAGIEVGWPDTDVLAHLGARLEWIEADWGAVPVEDQSIDIVFATNALPRNDIDERRRVVREWARVVRPGGLIFSAMHNPRGETAGPTLTSLGWQKTDVLHGTPVERTSARVFQENFSSG